MNSSVGDGSGSPPDNKSDWRKYLAGAQETKGKAKMNVQAHMSRPISGQVATLGGLSQQNVNPAQFAPMENLGIGGIGGIIGDQYNNFNLRDYFEKKQEARETRLKTNLQGYMSGQLPGQVPIQGGPALQNWNPLQTATMLNLRFRGIGGGIGSHPLDYINMSPEQFLKAREFMKGKIFEFLKKWHQQPISNASLIKCQQIAICLEEELFRSAQTEEDYMNLGTLQSRIQILIRSKPMLIKQFCPQLTYPSPYVAPFMPTHDTANQGLMLPQPQAFNVSSESLAWQSYWNEYYSCHKEIDDLKKECQRLKVENMNLTGENGRLKRKQEELIKEQESAKKAKAEAEKENSYVQWLYI
ncbi:hypothetical protein SLEP1_g36075 [Rubroshorea leprosula]|uniref:Uncharacterized protein n=1 Tax=Rubroshorea leprosula TaxID=152421 RepID=A0AAV5KQG9_9ROSI|nr:hypothetical protein SLEP1_g36075 [Rubroshorea leprosula]